MTRQTASKTHELQRETHPSSVPSQAFALPGPSGKIGLAEERPLLLGHRGARAVSRLPASAGKRSLPPENSLACFEYALNHGCDGFEFDVRITRDLRLVVCHNAWAGAYKVSASSFKSLSSRSAGQLACFEDVLREFADRAYLDIEVKVPGGEELIAKAIRHSRPRRGFLVSSFLPGVLRRLHELDPALPLGYVCSRSYNFSLWRKLPIEVFLPQHKLITHALVEEVHKRGRRIFTWTVNHEEEVRQLAAWGVDGLISDDPKLLGHVFPVRRGRQEAVGE